jgi:hypothetical protein
MAPRQHPHVIKYPHSMLINYIHRPRKIGSVGNRFINRHPILGLLSRCFYPIVKRVELATATPNLTSRVNKRGFRAAPVPPCHSDTISAVPLYIGVVRYLRFLRLTRCHWLLYPVPVCATHLALDWAAPSQCPIQTSVTVCYTFFSPATWTTHMPMDRHLVMDVATTLIRP